MTEKEAIEVLNGNVTDIDMVVIARAVAIKALEKQIPKKIILRNIPKTSWTKATSKYECPCCSRFIGFNGLNHCSVCGQRLKWGE